MNSHDAETGSVSATSLACPRDMQKELEEWRKRRSAKQCRAKKSTIGKDLAAASRTTQAASMGLRCCTNIEACTPGAAQERDMRKELAQWKEAKEARSHGKENCPSRALKSRASRCFIETQHSQRSVGPSVDLGRTRHNPCTHAIAVALETALPAPPPSPTAEGIDGSRLRWL